MPEGYSRLFAPNSSLLAFVTDPAPRLIHIRCAQHHLVIIRDLPVRIICNMAAYYADRMQLGHIISFCHKERHLPERFTGEIHVEPGYNDPDTAIGKFVTNIRQLVIKKLCFVYPYYVHILCKQ